MSTLFFILFDFFNILTLRTSAMVWYMTTLQKIISITPTVNSIDAQIGLKTIIQLMSLKPITLAAANTTVNNANTLVPPLIATALVPLLLCKRLI